MDLRRFAHAKYSLLASEYMVVEERRNIFRRMECKVHSSFSVVENKKIPRTIGTKPSENIHEVRQKVAKELEEILMNRSQAERKGLKPITTDYPRLFYPHFHAGQHQTEPIHLQFKTNPESLQYRRLVT